MTMRELDALMFRMDRARDLNFLRAGIVASVVANVNRKKGSRPFSPWDFVPGGKQQHQHQQTAEEQIAIFRSISDVVN
jgi:hypothetical protein